MFVRFHQNKCSKSLLISLSKALVAKGGMRLSSKRKKERKKGKKIKIAHVLTKFFQTPNKERDMF
jgi:hypothetical protein